MIFGIFDGPGVLEFALCVSFCARFVRVRVAGSGSFPIGLGQDGQIVVLLEWRSLVRVGVCSREIGIGQRGFRYLESQNSSYLRRPTCEVCAYRVCLR